MSRPYRILVQKVVEQKVTAADESVVQLQLDPILPEERLSELLADALTRRGWQPRGDNQYETVGPAGEELVCDLPAREVRARLAAETQVQQQVTRELHGDTWNWRQMREMTAAELDEIRAREEAQLVAEVTQTQRDRAETGLRRQVRERLEAGEDERRRALNGVVIEVVAQALKERAAELGHVENVSEHWDGDEYELTISLSE